MTCPGHSVIQSKRFRLRFPQSYYIKPLPPLAYFHLCIPIHGQHLPCPQALVLEHAVCLVTSCLSFRLVSVMLSISPHTEQPVSSPQRCKESLGVRDRETVFNGFLSLQLEVFWSIQTWPELTIAYGMALLVSPCAFSLCEVLSHPYLMDGKLGLREASSRRSRDQQKEAELEQMYVCLQIMLLTTLQGTQKKGLLGAVGC